MRRQSILFVYVNYSSFVKADFGILSGFADVTKYQFKPGKGVVRTGVEVLKQFIYLILNIRKFDSVFIWFGDYHSLLPVLFAKILGKKSFVVIGGYDVSTLKQYKYGSFSNPIRALFTRNTFKFVDICLPVAEALRSKLLLINPRAVAQTIATSVDPSKFNFSRFQRPKRVLTVSLTDNHQRMMIKGLDRFRELALSLPEFEFIIIGASQSVQPFFEPKPANLTLLPLLDFDLLTAQYQNAAFYAQLSRSEGLPNALCEAMLCGCIPVGTNVGDIEVTIGDCGLVIDDWKPEVLANFIRENYSNVSLRDRARERIITRYNPSVRTERFRQLMEK
jgi:glycosyltransferase involved in cell wall biosynthesis